MYWESVMGLFFRISAAIAVAGCVALDALAQTYAARAVEVERLIGAVRVVGHAEAGVQVKISGSAQRAYLPVVRLEGGTVKIDGGQSLKDVSCRSDARGMIVKHRGWVQAHPISRFPVVTIYAPDDVALRIRRSMVTGSTGRLGEAHIEMTGCGHLDVAGVTGRLDLASAGSGSAKIGPVGEAEVGIAGSGAIELARVGGSLRGGIAGSGTLTAGAVGGAELSVAGSGSIEIVRVEGPVEVSVAGSGSVQIEAGRATSFHASTFGSGDLVFGGIAVDPDVVTFGSGSVQIGAVEGRLNQSKEGVGSVRIGGR
jgi:hypothetical protein